MTNKKAQRIKRAKLKADQTSHSSRAGEALEELNEKNIMNKNYNRMNRNGNGYGNESGYAYEDIVTVVNEEFAKNATPEVTKAAILARLTDDCSCETRNVSSYRTQTEKDAAIAADAASPVSAKHTADIANAVVTG